MSNADFENFVRRELGDIAVMDDGRYISPKIQKYWLTWCAATESAAQACEKMAAILAKSDAPGPSPENAMHWCAAGIRASASEPLPPPPQMQEQK